MNILLANMPIEFNKRENLEPPLGICYLAAMIKDIEGVKVAVKDYEIREFTSKNLTYDLSGVNILGISFRTASYRSAKEFAGAARKMKKDLFIVAGGHHATAFPKETLLDLGCDALVFGEGEYAFRELVGRLTKGSSLEGLKGVAYRNASSGAAVINEKRQPIDDIGRLPWPARELLDLGNYSVMTILTSRGCPFNCIYCDKGISTRTVKFRSPEDIFAEIKYIATALNKHRLYVVDDHFFLKRDRLEPVLDKIIETRLPVKWVCQARVDALSEDLLVKAKLAGCEQIMYGIETGDEIELKYMRKSSTLRQAEEAVALTRKAGIAVRANFMLGFPVSTRETVKNTINFAKRIKPDIVRFFAVSPLPNTDLWDDIYGKGRIPDKIRWEEINFYNPSFDIKSVPREEISLYVSAGYWHVLKGEFLKEVTVMLIPNAVRLLALILMTGKIRGNISKAFPKTVNLIVDNLHQAQGKDLRGILSYLSKVRALEKTL